MKIKCPSCNLITLAINEEATFFKQVELYKTFNLILPLEDPPKILNTVEIKCYNQECNYFSTIDKYEYIDLVIQHWSNINWKIYLNQFKNSYSNDEYFTKYLENKNINDLLEKIKKEKNPLIKDLVKYIEKKHT